MSEKFGISQNSLTKAVSWSFISETLIKLIQPASYFILMLMLSPQEMGLMVSALVVMSFAQIFWEAGLGKELIRRKENFSQAANVAFFTNVIIALLFSILVISIPQSLVNMFGNGSEVYDIIKIMVLHMVLASLSSVQIAILQKKLDFKNLAAVKLSNAFFTALISILLAYNGYSVWSLVAGALTGQLVQLLMSYKVSDWRPGFDFGDKLLHTEMFKFSIWVLLSSLLIWFFAWADSLIVGVFFGNEALGLYRSASILAAGFFGLFLGPIIPVLYSSLSKLKSIEAHALTANILVNSVIFLAIPFSWGLFFSGSFIETFILPESWEGFAIIFSMLSLMHGYAWIVGYNGEFFRAKGRPELETLVTGASALFYSIGYIISAQLSFDAFLNMRVILVLIGLFFQIFILCHVTKLNMPYLIYNFLITSILSCGIFILSEFIMPMLFNYSPIWFLNIILSLLIIYALLYISRLKSFILFIQKELGD